MPLLTIGIVAGATPAVHSAVAGVCGRLTAATGG
jgi:hypothetical protein